MTAPTPKHGVTTPPKLAQMIADMRAADGWPVGMPPVLVAGDNEALTGSHRLAAARALDLAPYCLDIQDAIDQLIDDGYDWAEITMMDDYGLAHALRGIGRAGRSDLGRTRSFRLWREYPPCRV